MTLASLFGWLAVGFSAAHGKPFFFAPVNHDNVFTMRDKP
jgi:hypothetical protein